MAANCYDEYMKLLMLRSCFMNKFGINISTDSLIQLTFINNSCYCTFSASINVDYA